MKKITPMMIAFLMVFTGMVVMGPSVVMAAETVTIHSEDTVEVDGSGFANKYEDHLIPLRMGDQVVYCLDDGVLDPLGMDSGGSDYEEFDTSLAPEFEDSETVKLLKKLFYFGAPNDGGDIVDWILNEGTDLNYSEYTEEDAKYYLEFMTRELIHNITNEVQGVPMDPESKPVYIGTYQILDQVIDRETGEFINDAKDRFDGGVITLYDMVAQKLWQKVIDADTDDVADLVELHIYTIAGSQQYARPDDPTATRQRILGAEIKDAPEEEETTVVLIAVEVKKNWLDETPESLDVQLMKNGEAEGETVTLTAEDDWTYFWGELPQCDEDGEAYEYTVEETVPDGYTQIDSETETDEETGAITVTLTNAKDEESEDEESEDEESDEESKDEEESDEESKDEEESDEEEDDGEATDDENKDNQEEENDEDGSLGPGEGEKDDTVNPGGEVEEGGRRHAREEDTAAPKTGVEDYANLYLLTLIGAAAAFTILARKKSR